MVGLELLLAPDARIWDSTDGESLPRDVTHQRMTEPHADPTRTSLGVREARTSLAHTVAGRRATPE